MVDGGNKEVENGGERFRWMMTCSNIRWGKPLLCLQGT